MAKNITTFVKSIGANRVSAQVREITRCYWDFVPRNTFHDDRSCVNFHHEPFFCVPSGICCMKFEIWGAGGRPTGGCNCMHSPPSGSGAYATKTITVTPSECYRIHVGWNYCCSPPQNGSDTVYSDYCSQTNKHTWITGTGLVNFCAEQGCSARTCCCNTATWATNCAKYQNDSDGAGGRFFGADFGVRGKIGFLELRDSSSDPTDYFNYRQWIPFPGGMINKYGGHMMAGLYHDGMDNVCCTNDHADGQMGRFFGLEQSNPRGSGRYAGWGMAGVPFCGGSQACGAYMNSGRVRISYSCANTFVDED